MANKTLNFDGVICRSNGSAGGDEFLRMMAAGYSRLNCNRGACIERLRGMGVRLAHADDGWVDRERNIITPPSYRLFDDAPGVGDLIAIGSATDDERVGNFRLAKVTKVVPCFLGGALNYHFEPTGERIVVGQSLPTREV